MKRSRLPKFRSEAEERKYWERHDSADRVDWRRAQPVAFARLRTATKPISLRLPTALLDSIRAQANKRDVPYQSLIKVWLAEKVAEATR
jgi:predicted DNA binding CopG/RHH family protein